jgi:hypothetical protein
VVDVPPPLGVPAFGRGQRRGAVNRIRADEVGRHDLPLQLGDTRRRNFAPGPKAMSAGDDQVFVARTLVSAASRLVSTLLRA